LTIESFEASHSFGARRDDEAPAHHVMASNPNPESPVTND
jgi:hypothetical protein